MPDEFRGIVWFVEFDDAAEIPVEGAKRVIRVPPGGVVRVKSYKPLTQWHQESWRFASGASIPSKSPSDLNGLPPGQVAEWSCGGISINGPYALYCVISTASDFPSHARIEEEYAVVSRGATRR